MKICPLNLKQKLYTTAAVDNIDHNPTSTTSQKSFHGTGVSIFQHPCRPDDGVEQTTASVTFCDDERTDHVLKDFLNVNLDVPFIKRGPNGITVSYKSDETFNKYTHEEMSWTQEVGNEVSSPKGAHVSWSSHHAKNSEVAQAKSISAMLPLIDEKSTHHGTIKHVMDNVSSITSLLSPEQQMSILAADQPVYTVAKQIQWAWPDLYRKDKFFILMGGLHIEMKIMEALGLLLEGTGWIQCLAKADICGPGTADSFLTVAHVKRSRYAHEVTAACLGILQMECFETATECREKDQEYAEWKRAQAQRQSMFFFWSLILDLQTVLLSFLRSTRTGNIEAYIEM